MEQTPSPICIDVKTSFTAVNPANGHIYNEYNAVVFYAADRRLIQALRAYKDACAVLGADAYRILSIELLIDRVRLFQDKGGPDESNIIDRKFITKARLRINNQCFNQVSTIVFCAKDKALPALINEYINMEIINNQPNYDSTQSLKDLLDRVMFYQENIEAKLVENKIMNTTTNNDAAIKPTRPICIKVLTLQSLEELLRITPTDNNGRYSSLQGAVIHIDDPGASFYATYVNRIGVNRSINDWHRIISSKDPLFVSIIREVNNIPSDTDVKIELIDDYSKSIDFIKDHRCYIDSLCCKELRLGVRDVNSVYDLTNIPEYTENTFDGKQYKLSLFGDIARVDSKLIWINITGRNQSMNDWYCIKSVTDPVFIDIIRKCHNIEHLVRDIRVVLVFDKS